MKLTSAQLQAVQAPIHLPVRVLAPPGSGKTTVIAHRYAYLVSQGVSPREIVAVTFSRSMADELLSRIQVLTPSAYAPQICTIHALCYRILNAEGDNRSVARTWQIKKTIEESMLQTFLQAGWREILYWIDRSKAEGIRTQDARDFFSAIPDISPYASDLAYIRERLDAFLAENNLLTFPDMLLDIETRLQDDEAFRARWQSYFSYIIVDEGQDTSGQAMRILTTLAAPQDRFFIVGDPDQLLYRWSGATPEANLFQGFDKRFPNGLTIKLDHNFRSTGRIVKASTALISHNYEPKGPYPRAFFKEPLYTAPEGREIEFTLYEDEFQESRGVVSKIKELLDEYQPADFFIGARTRAQLAFLEGELVRAKIPFVNATGSSFWNLKHVSDMVAYLKLALFQDDEAFCQVYDISSKRMRQPFDSRTRRKGSYSPNRWLGRKFLEAAHYSFSGIHRALNSRDGWRWREGVDDLLYMLDEIRSAGTFIGSLELIKDHYLAYLSADGFVQEDVSEDSRVEDLNTVIEIASTFDSAQAFLNYVQECRSESGQSSWDGKVVLSTVHRLKGMERRVVFGIGWNEGLLPHAFSLGLIPNLGVLPSGSKGRIEDERCIAFVLVTRAKERVYLSSIRKYRDKPLQPSRFLYELGVLEDEQTPEML